MNTRNEWVIKSYDRIIGIMIVAVTRKHKAVLRKISKRVFLYLHILLEINLLLRTNPSINVNSNLSLSHYRYSSMKSFLEEMIPFLPR